MAICSSWKRQILFPLCEDDMKVLKVFEKKSFARYKIALRPDQQMQGFFYFGSSLGVHYISYENLLFKRQADELSFFSIEQKVHIMHQQSNKKAPTHHSYHVTTILGMKRAWPLLAMLTVNLSGENQMILLLNCNSKPFGLCTNQAMTSTTDKLQIKWMKHSMQAAFQGREKHKIKELHPINVST